MRRTDAGSVEVEVPVGATNSRLVWGSSNGSVQEASGSNSLPVSPLKRKYYYEMDAGNNFTT